MDKEPPITRRIFLREALAAFVTALATTTTAAAADACKITQPYESLENCTTESIIEELRTNYPKAAKYIEDYLPKEDQNIIARHVLNAITSLKERDPKNLLSKSTPTMRKLSESQANEFLNANIAKLIELNEKLKYEETAVLVDGKNNKIYLIEKNKNEEGRDVFKAIRSYSVSVSKKGFNNTPESGGTSFGLHRITLVNKGDVGQVVSHEVINKKEGGKIYVSNLHSGSEKPQIVTNFFTIQKFNTEKNKLTEENRGLGIHGSNKEKDLGKAASAGCIRMSNIDIADLESYVGTDTWVMVTLN